MITFSDDPDLAEREMHAVIFWLTTFGYIDGDFDANEKRFVRDYIERLVQHRVRTALPDEEKALHDELVAKYTRHFHESFEGIDREVGELFHEPVARGEDRNAFVHFRLKLRCFEIFRAFDRPSQEHLLASIDDLLLADGHAHPAELAFRAELAALLESDERLDLVEEDATPPPVHVEAARTAPPPATAPPIFDPLETHWSADPGTIARQIAWDRDLVDRTVRELDRRRQAGAGRLAGRRTVADLRGADPFLDGHVHVVAPRPGRTFELTVLGDLHGCYSVLKAAVVQSRFLERVEAHRRDPERAPEPRLVLLGDYIDRGLYSLNGVLRCVMQLFLAAPDHVVVLRGNHEYYVEVDGTIHGGVRPAEAIGTLRPHVPAEVFRDYMRLFDALPTVLLFDRLMFVHGGIPRDRTVKERWRDLSSLNDPDIRFQMLWSDPSAADVVPAKLQDQAARFAFGRLQAHAFLQRIGCHTIVRGHEKVDAGFRRVYDDGQIVAMTLFSAGGRDNGDLPAGSTYRSVTPMALSVRWQDGHATFVPWAPDWRAMNDPARNAFFRAPPEIPHRAD